MTDLIKVSELTEETSPTLQDYLSFSKDTGASYASRKASLLNILSKPLAPLPIAYSSTITTDCLLAVNFKVAVLEGTLFLANPSNLIPGQEYKWTIQQGDTGYAVTFGSAFDIPSGQAVDTTANTTSIVRGYYDGIKIRTQIETGYAYIPPPFSIEGLASLKLWTGARYLSGLTNGQTITSLNPPAAASSLPAFTAPGSGGIYVTNVQNGLPGIKAVEGNTSHRFLASSISFSPSFTIIAVIKCQTSAGPYGVVSGGGAEMVNTKSQSTPHFRVYDSTLSSSSEKNLTSGWATSAAKIIRHECDGTHAGHKVYINGALQSLTDGSSTANPGTTAATRNVYLFGNGLDAVYLENNHILEILFCSPKISNSDAFAIETTFSNDYDIPI